MIVIDVFMLETDRTYKLDCGASMKLKRTRDKTMLYLDHLDLTHNHAINKLTKMGYPESRRPSKEAVKRVEELGKLKVKPSLIRPYLKELEQDSNNETCRDSKIILGRDISNIK